MGTRNLAIILAPYILLSGCTSISQTTLSEETVHKHCTDIITTYYNTAPNIALLPFVQESAHYSKFEWDSATCESLEYLVTEDTYICLCTVSLQSGEFKTETPNFIKVSFTIAGDSITSAEVTEYVEEF